MKYLKDVSTLVLNPEKCTGCRRCIEVCPRGVFEMRDGKAHVTDIDLCMECGACASNCESGALSVNSGVGCAAALINSMIKGGPPVCGCSESGENISGGGCC